MAKQRQRMTQAEFTMLRSLSRYYSWRTYQEVWWKCNRTWVRGSRHRETAIEAAARLLTRGLIDGQKILGPGLGGKRRPAMEYTINDSGREFLLTAKYANPQNLPRREFSPIANLFHHVCRRLSKIFRPLSVAQPSQFITDDQRR